MPDFMLGIALQTLATALPLFIVWIIGIVVTIVRWKKDRKKALFTLLGILLLGFARLLEIVWNLFGVRKVNTD